jgi:hypothetical protein
MDLTKRHIRIVPSNKLTTMSLYKDYLSKNKQKIKEELDIKLKLMNKICSPRRSVTVTKKPSRELTIS